MIEYKLRPYQQTAVNSVIDYIKRNNDPCLLEIATGGGKAIICAEIARILHTLSNGKRVLIIVPSAELVRQNKEAFDLTGMKSSIFSASVEKSIRHKVVFCTPMSIKSKIKDLGDVAGVIIDEAHFVANTHEAIISEIRESNPNVRVIGMSATPMKLGRGWIYEIDEKNRIVQDAINPFFKKLLYRIDFDLLVDNGFLTPYIFGHVAHKYDTSELVIDKRTHKYTEESIDRAFVGKGRLTSDIVADIVEKSKARNARCVMVFAANIKHALEIMESLPPELSKLVTGDTPKKEREKIIRDAKNKGVKYLVNVATLTTGVSINHVDIVAIMRSSESPALIIQIAGRGSRLDEGKEDFLILDYGNNIERLFEDNSLSKPIVKSIKKSESVEIEVSCPDCGTQQKHTKRFGYEDWDEFGYAVDLAGDRLEPPIPSHYGRRCLGVVLKGRNQYERCSYFWTCKECPICSHKNDIAARICESCSHELIDPNTKLSEIAYNPKVGDTFTTDVLKMEIERSTDGNRVLAKFYTAHGKNIASAFYPTTTNYPIRAYWTRFKKLTNNGELTPKQIRYTVTKKGCTINEYIM